MNNVPTNSWRHAGSPFHAVSLAIQKHLGVAEQLDAYAKRGVAAQLTGQHREFFAQLPFVVAATVDAEGQPWASMLFGAPGFMQSLEPGSLRVAAMPVPGDPLAERFVAGAPVGLLGIEPSTRRRNRVNGRIAANDAAGKDVGFTLQVEQAFGNCPKYIRNRSARVVAADAPRRTHASTLDSEARQMIAVADTFFIASAFREGIEGRVPFHGVEVSHRGGKPGFVHIEEDGSLLVPDFVGNFQFRTIGNLVSEPRAGLLFPDFAAGNMLFVAADAEIIWGGPQVDAFIGAERLLRFRVREMVRIEAVMPLRFEDGERSPFLERTGSWGDVRR